MKFLKLKKIVKTVLACLKRKKVNATDALQSGESSQTSQAEEVFHLFSKLPPELQIQIWKDSMEPRVITLIDPLNRRGTRELEFTCLGTYNPAILHVSSMSRAVGLEFYEAKLVKLGSFGNIGDQITPYSRGRGPGIYVNTKGPSADIAVCWVHGWCCRNWFLCGRFLANFKHIVLTYDQYHQIHSNLWCLERLLDRRTCEKITIWNAAIKEKGEQRQEFTIVPADCPFEFLTNELRRFNCELTRMVQQHPERNWKNVQLSYGEPCNGAMHSAPSTSNPVSLLSLSPASSVYMHYQ